MSKIVYFLGAGFSKALGAPAQSEILPSILNHDSNDLIYNINGAAFLSERNYLESFLNRAFIRVPQNQWKQITLEDIFSILDRAIINKDSFRKLSQRAILRARAALVHTIIHLFDARLRQLNRENILDRFINNMFSVENNFRKYSIITTNWDIIIDNCLYPKVINNGPGQNEIYFLDYGCECQYFRHREHSIDQYNGRKRFNLFKLHGSLNWLICPNCNRLFFQIGEKIAIREFIDPFPCEICSDANDNYKRWSYNLQSLVIMPTMLKALGNLHLQQVWHKAAQTLAEADQLIFIGYSFPLADFEIRYLLAHHLKKNCRVRVILHTNDNPATYHDAPRELFASWRYQTFFGLSDSQNSFEGLEGYVNSRHHS